jgi:hypothetical protein
MSYTFPEDSAGKAGAVHPTENNNDFYVPAREQGSGSIKGALATVSASGTRVQLPDYPCREVTIIGKRTNTGYIYVGGSDVNTTTIYGVEIGPRDSHTFKVSNTNLLYIDASVSGEGVSYVAI